MNNLIHNTKQPLVYSGFEIRARGEMMSLTDMWKAAGSEESKRPTDWAALPQSKGFIEAVALSSNAEISGIWKSRRGNNGGTYAHWQVALAYAKYLSPEFHMWCNQVVRDRMEGRSVPSIPADLAEMMERDHGMLRMLSHKVTNIEKALPGIIEDYLASALAQKVAEHAIMFRHGVTAKQVWDDFKLPRKLRGSTVWLGNRLAEMGCLLDGELRAQRGVMAVRLFDPDRSKVCMNNGLFLSAQAYASEKLGQGRLRLVPTNPGAGQ